MNKNSDVPPFTEAEIDLASSNYEAQEWLVRRLAEAFTMCRHTYSELGTELGLSGDEVKSWLDGEVDLTLSELRQLANSVDAHITYSVRPLRTLYIDRFKDIANHSQWKDVTWTQVVPT